MTFRLELVVPTTFTLRVESETPAEIQAIHVKLDKIMSTQAEAAEKLTNVTAQLVKVGEEIKGVQGAVDVLNKKIEELQAAAGQSSPELQAAVDAVAAQAQVVDDEIPDAPTV